MTQKKVDEIVKSISGNFRTFGGGDKNPNGNPIAMALKDNPLSFAAGVDVEQVVLHVLKIGGIKHLPRLKK